MNNSKGSGSKSTKTQPSPKANPESSRGQTPSFLLLNLLVPLLSILGAYLYVKHEKLTPSIGEEVKRADSYQISSAFVPSHGELAPWPLEPTYPILAVDGVFSNKDVQRHNKLLKGLQGYRDEADFEGGPVAGKAINLYKGDNPQVDELVAQLMDRANVSVVAENQIARGIWNWSGVGLVFYRAYVTWTENRHVPGAHEDADDPYHITVLLYVNPDNHLQNGACGGETVFFDENKDIIRAVIPKPGRVCIFVGNVSHTARPFLASCKQPRLTLVLKIGAEEYSKPGVEIRDLRDESRDNA